MYDWVTVLYKRNWHNIVNQLNFKKEKKRILPNPYDIVIKERESKRHRI